jgi:hypothetical protein
MGRKRKTQNEETTIQRGYVNNSDFHLSAEMQNSIDSSHF